MPIESPISSCLKLKRVLSDHTRALVFNELLMGGELTASIISQRLQLSFTKVSYHVRKLLAAEAIEPTRQVIAGFRVEKFYRIKPQLLALLFSTPNALGGIHQGLTPAERQVVHCAYLVVVANVLKRAADRYERMDPEQFDILFSQDELMMLSFGSMPRGMLKQLLRVAKAALPETWGDLDAVAPWQHSDYVVFATLPEFFRAPA